MLALLAVMAGVPCAGASEFNLLGFYVGEAIGDGRDAVDADNGLKLGGHATGCKVMAGLRPISVVGAEVEYIDLGFSSTDAYLV